VRDVVAELVRGRRLVVLSGPGNGTDVHGVLLFRCPAGHPEPSAARRPGRQRCVSHRHRVRLCARDTAASGRSAGWVRRAGSSTTRPPTPARCLSRSPSRPASRLSAPRWWPCAPSASGHTRPRRRSRRPIGRRSFYRRPLIPPPVRDRGLVPLDRPVNRQLRGVAESAHRLPRRGDPDPDMEHRRDQRHDRSQRPALVLAVAGGGRPQLKPSLEPGQLVVGQFRGRPGRTLGPGCSGTRWRAGAGPPGCASLSWLPPPA
jgi:hypothetical protein